MNIVQEKLVLNLLQRYKKSFLKIPISVDGADELYKWQLITMCHEKLDIEIIRNFKTKNIVDTQRVNQVLSDLLKNKQQQLIDCFSGLKNESLSLSGRLSLFKKMMGDLCGDKYKSKANDERTAAAFLACWNPEKYTFFKDEIYQNYCSYIGEKPHATGEKYPHFLQLLTDLVEVIKQDSELTDKFQSETNGLIQSDMLTAQNILWQMKDIMNIATNNNTMEQLNTFAKILNLKKNIILQGAPGTGKTYNTAALALNICGVNDVDFSNHNAVMERYEQMRYDNKKNPDGQIGFCTFHQSMDYEDFVEGIKPKTENENVTYEIEPGIFKFLCENAKNITTERKSKKIDFSKTRIFKMSLGQKGKDDTEIFDYCIEHNVVGLGWGEDKDFSQCTKREDFKALDNTWGAIAMEIFLQWMQIGDIVLVSDGTKSVKAIAQITGDYVFRKDAPIDMCQFRGVKWLYTGDVIPISKFYDKNLSQQSIYGFFNSNKYGQPDFNGTIKVDFINDIITGKIDNETPQNYVLIIDEINRGNVSKIFGELITLLESDKRIGGDHPIKVTLPYSKDSFGVPSNLYIIGTMNTTDRSVGTIDYAVRRRFAFATLESKKEVIEEYYKNDDSLKNKALSLFESIRSFLKKHKFEMDIEDLMVGHSYFLARNEEELDLKWKYEIVPLLHEYYKDGIIKQDINADTTIENFCN